MQGKGQKKFIRTTGSNNLFEQSAIASTFVSRDSASVDGRRIFQSTILAATGDFSHYQAAFYSMPVLVLPVLPALCFPLILCFLPV